MDGSQRSSLHVWDDAGIDEGDSFASIDAVPFPDPELAERYAMRECWRLPSSRRTPSTQEPFTLPWFLQLERRRYARQGYWIPKLLEFHKHRNERLLAIGDSVGTDWARYAENDTDVIVCHRSAQHLSIVRRHLELRGLRGQYVNGTTTSLPIRSDSLDVACLFEPSLSGEEIEATVRELFRTLKPGGKVIAVVRASYNARYWQDCLIPWQRWLWPASPVESGECFTGRELVRHFHHFTGHRLYKRHLRRSELPHLWRWMALPLLERLMGRFLVFKAYKPISAAVTIAQPAAA